jgi:hypothetical protein
MTIAVDRIPEYSPMLVGSEGRHAHSERRRLGRDLGFALPVAPDRDGKNNDGALVVSWDEAGLGNQNVTYTLTADATVAASSRASLRKDS